MGRVLEELDSPGSSVERLRELTSAGLPLGVSWCQRAKVWRLLLGIMPPGEKGEEVLRRRREKYTALASARFNCAVEPHSGGSGSPLNSPPRHDEAPAESDMDYQQLRQVRLDLVRTRPDYCPEVISSQSVQYVLTRLLYIWGISNPACGYVQGINDIAIPFFLVFLFASIEQHQPVERTPDPALLLDADVLAAESDTFLSLQVVLNEVQDYYITGRPGITDYAKQLDSMLVRNNPELHAHLQHIGVSANQFALRWVNCLFAREFQTQSLIRLWDGMIAEGVQNLKATVLYVSLALLMRFSAEIRQRDFEQAMLFLQKLPTTSWPQERISELLAEAYVWRCLFSSAPHHLA